MNSDLKYKLNQRFPEKVIREKLDNIFKQRISACEHFLDKEFEEYNKLYREGVPFEKRKELLDLKRINFALQELDRLKEKQKRYRTKPLPDIVRGWDIYFLQMVGLERYLWHFFKEAIY